MAYDERLAGKISELLEDVAELTEKRMFGGIAFMVLGHMCCGVFGDRLVVRVGPEQYEKAVSRAHAEPMDFTGKPMRGLIYVRPEGLKSRKQLSSWITKGLDFVGTLPAKLSAKR